MKVWLPDATDDLTLEREVLGEALADVQTDPAEIGVAIVHQTVVDAAWLARLPQLRGVVRLGVGYDKVDLPACQARGVAVANVPDYCTAEVADTALAMILSLVRGCSELEAALHADAGRWQTLSLPRVRRSAALTLGVLGAGRIGQAVLARAAAFGFSLLFCDPAVLAVPGAERVSLAQLLQRADILSLHLPLNAETRGVVDANFLAQMKPGALLVNTARGGLLGDEQALLNALASGHLAGAALDVLPVEPPDHRQPLFAAWFARDPRLAGKLLLNPHNAFYSQESAREVRRLAAEEAARLLAGQPFRHGIPLEV